MTKFLLLLLFFLFFPQPVLASYQSAKIDYTYQYSKYRNAIDGYQVAKSTYLTYRTLSSQNQAITSFRAAIQARNDVIAAYYNLLQEKLNATVGVPDSFRQTFAGIKNSENAWLADHHSKIDAAASLEDLNQAAIQFESRYPQFDHETKQAIGQVLLTKEANLKSDAENIVASFSGKLIEMRQAGEDTATMDRGLFAVRNKLELSTQKQLAARSVFLREGEINIYEGAQRLTESNQYLREGLNFLRELVRDIIK